MKKTIALAFAGIILSVGIAQARPNVCRLSEYPAGFLSYWTIVPGTGTITSSIDPTVNIVVTGTGAIAAPALHATYTIKSGACVSSVVIK